MKTSDLYLNLGPLKVAWDRDRRCGLILIPALYYMAYFSRAKS